MIIRKENKIQTVIISGQELGLDLGSDQEHIL